jgi:REase_MTES_1575
MRRRYLHSSPSARDRDRLRQEQLERQGWRFHRIWSTEWFHDREACADKAVAAYHDAVLAADDGKPAGQSDSSAASTPPGGNESATAARPQTAYVAAPSRITVAPGQRTGARPPVIGGQPIEAYSDAQLLNLARWVRTDDVLRTEDELLQEMMRELGFQRRGKNVVARLTSAIALSARMPPGRRRSE